MSGHIVRIVARSTHDDQQEVVDDYLVNEADAAGAVSIVRAGVELPTEAEATVLPQVLTGSTFNDAGVPKGGFTRLRRFNQPRAGEPDR